MEKKKHKHFDMYHCSLIFPTMLYTQFRSFVLYTDDGVSGKCAGLESLNLKSFPFIPDLPLTYIKTLCNFKNQSVIEFPQCKIKIEIHILFNW